MPASATQRGRALGSLEEVEPSGRSLLDPSDFEPLPEPGRGDWLDVHPERGQTFEQFLAGPRRRPGPDGHVIALLPVGGFDPERSPSMEVLERFARAFFQMPVRVLDAVEPGRERFTTRINPYGGQRQVLTVDVLESLRGRRHRDVFCVLAVTMEDLYPQPSWNFVFGQASLREGVGVFSFARYDPAFRGQSRPPRWLRLLTRRSVKVLAHETAHMFSLAHCVYYRCIMNGSNHLDEADRRPAFLCPVCLRKIRASIGFDMVERYRRMLEFFDEQEMEAERRWLRGRLERASR
jgi:archaemetzincin